MDMNKNMKGKESNLNTKSLKIKKDNLNAQKIKSFLFLILDHLIHPVLLYLCAHSSSAYWSKSNLCRNFRHFWYFPTHRFLPIFSFASGVEINLWFNLNLRSLLGYLSAKFLYPSVFFPYFICFSLHSVAPFDGTQTKDSVEDLEQSDFGDSICEIEEPIDCPEAPDRTDCCDALDCCDSPESPD